MESRHGWGCTPDTEQAVKYLSSAASNAASVEQLALQAGLKKGGAAKGELVLAIFELANCFRHGWGIPQDPIAAKQVSLHFCLCEWDTLLIVFFFFATVSIMKRQQIWEIQTP